MNFIFLMDPLHTVKYEKDTSFIIMLGAVRAGHKIFFLPEGGISFHEDKLRFHVTEVTPQDNPEELFKVGAEKTLLQDEVHVIFVRTDPPFDGSYLINTWLLDHLPESIPVINHPTGIRTANEKIWAMQFEKYIPKTLVSCRIDEMMHFLKEEKDIIVKPTDGFGGSSVFRLREGDQNARVTFETLTKNEKEYLILQKYIEDAEVGDKRIILLDGEPLGAVLRVHATGEHRNNFFAGGTACKTEITERDQEIIETLKPKLQELGLTFVGIDIIGDYLIEVNVTSPTCLQEMNQLYGMKLEEKVVSFVEGLIKTNHPEMA